MDNLLCGIHFMTGDLAMSESYALDAMTQSKRGGNTRALRRLVQINLLRGEYALAGKYIALLEQMPFYKEWADEYSGYLSEPERIADNPELKGKIVAPDSLDNLMSLMTTEKLWNVHTAENRIGWEYLGCYYLLDKNLSKFNSYIEESGVEHLPRHFQEALLIEGCDSVSNNLVKQGKDSSLSARSWLIFRKITETCQQFIMNLETHTGFIIISKYSRTKGNDENILYTFRSILPAFRLMQASCPF